MHYIQTMNCRAGCGACCTAPSISSPIPGMPNGKPAGTPCIQLDAQARCRIFGLPERPAACASLQPHPDMCGQSKAEAHAWLARLERLTTPVTYATLPRQTRIAPELKLSEHRLF